MSSHRIRTSAAAITAVVAFPLSLGAFAPQAFADNTASSTPSPFGPGCSSLPHEGKGSAKGMAKERVATAAANNPKLTKLALALKDAGLTTKLNDAKHVTLFAPTNAAFDKISKMKLAGLLKDKAQLKKVLTYHVVDKTITPSELPNGSFKTREGSMLKTTGSGTSFKVNDTAEIVCGDIKTANATVYLVDKVLMPPS
ncbi:fasciclin domain-containing protein [Streptomyces sp. NBC_01242]|uniref:fasciclin domain-containing protein n=1 Tax=Streptomyces sp. NBC_01242 TaxID=2903795 RepID=UPI002258CA6E|nr:fasciclin domain-containing protein [Streptomyces sp. NBC_01242]MCX4798996.1 fasciclin domain-containing protein [Streptomyces sp. NBC_01242]